jgi:hypothetical protein
MLTTLREALTNWTDFDGAEFVLAKCLGAMPDIEWNPGDRTKPGASMKATFWTANLFGDSLAAILEHLVVMGAVEKNEDGQFRWNQTFDWDKCGDQDHPSYSIDPTELNRRCGAALDAFDRKDPAKFLAGIKEICIEDPSMTLSDFLLRAGVSDGL